VIDRYLLDPMLAKAVDSAVAGPYADVVAIENKQNCDGGADERAAFITKLLQAVVGADQVLLAACQQFGRRRGICDRGEFVDDDAACYFASRMAAHAVRNGPQAARRRNKVVVFVLPPHLADMRCGARLNP
jgi:hypothetical protein